MELTRPVVAVETEAFGTVYVPRLSTFVIDAVKKRANELYPLPDEKPFEKPLPNALIEGDVIPGKENPEYKKAVDEVMFKRNRHWQFAILNMVEILDSNGERIPQGEIIALYRSVLEPMLEATAISGDENRFALTLFYCALKPAEYVEIVTAARREQGLSQEEIRNGLRIFRRDIQRHSTNGHHPESQSSDLQGVEQVQTQ